MSKEWTPIPVAESVVKLQATRHRSKLEKEEGRKYSQVLPCYTSLQEHPRGTNTSQHLRVCTQVWATQVQLRLVHTGPTQSRQADSPGEQREPVGRC